VIGILLWSHSQVSFVYSSSQLVKYSGYGQVADLIIEAVSLDREQIVADIVSEIA